MASSLLSIPLFMSRDDSDNVGHRTAGNFVIESKEPQEARKTGDGL